MWKFKAVGFCVHACGCIIEAWHEMACKVKRVMHDFTTLNAKHGPLCGGLRLYGLVFMLVGASLKLGMNSLQCKCVMLVGTSLKDDMKWLTR